MIYYFITSLLLFLIGVCGVFLSRKNILLLLMSLELMLLSVTYNFLFFSILLDDLQGQMFALFILAVAASESALGLALVVAYYQWNKIKIK
jgi:NADH-quinone oxidoreductase subunit K